MSERAEWQWVEFYADPPSLVVRVDQPDPTPVILGPDGNPLPIRVHRFGFQASMQWHTPEVPE